MYKKWKKGTNKGLLQTWVPAGKLGGLLPPFCNKTKPCSRTSRDPVFICITGCKIGWGVAELWEVWCAHSRAGTAGHCHYH